MRRTRSCLFVLLLLVSPQVAHAESDFWDTISSFSGPGPFKGVTFGQRVLCVKENDDGRTHTISTCMSDVDARIKALLNVEAGYYTSGDNPRFTDTPGDRRTVHMIRVHSTYMYRASPMLDVGVGGGVLILTGEGFENQTHPVLTPLAVTFTPFGFIRSSPRATKWGRLLRVTFVENYVLGQLNAADFNSASTYSRSSEFIHKFGIGVDIGSLIGR
jgi:hypothetical protein